MKHFLNMCAALAVTALLTAAAFAQPGEKKDGDKKGPPFAGGFGGQFNPVLRALDENKDGELSADEIKNAAAALKALDKNSDGKLSAEELRPSFGAGGFGGPGGFGRPGGNDPKAFMERMKGLDKNKDGKLSKDELPEFLRERFLERADTNKDGVIDEKELQKASENPGGGFGRPGGGGGGTGNRQPGVQPRPVRPDGDNGERQKRPARPDA